MNYILDTHYVLWSLFEPERIGKEILTILKDEDTTKLVSGISLLEISFKYSLGKLELSGTNPNEIYVSIKESGMEMMPVENEIFASHYKLPKKDKHKDPFDRILIWQAIRNDLTLITKDSRMEAYISDGLKIKLGR